MYSVNVSSLLIALGTFVLAGAEFGCASAHDNGVHDRAIDSVASAETTSARADSAQGVSHLELGTAVRGGTREAPLGNGGGVLVVGSDVFDSCASVRHVRVQPSDDKAWLALAKSVAHCVNDGELKSRSIVLHGEARPQVIVKYMFTRLGVPESRIEMSSTTGLATCTDDCDADDLRIEIGVAGSVPNATTASAMSDRSGL